MASNPTPVASVMVEQLVQQLANDSDHGQGRHRNGSASKAFSGDNSTTLPLSGQQRSTFVKSSTQQRMGIIITTVFSILAVLIVLFAIIREAYVVKPGQVYSRAQRQTSLFKKLHPADVFPFVIALAILVQGFIFIGVQAGGLEDFGEAGCRLTSELVWPALFIAIVFIFIFGVDTTARALKRERFSPRGRFTTPVCIATSIIVLLVLWLISLLSPSLDVCPASLSWWTIHYSKIGVVLGVVLMVAHLACAGTIIMQLLKANKIDDDERIAASRTVYTMLINVVILILVLPFWIQVTAGVLPLQSSKVADIGITLTGMLFGALHIGTRTKSKSKFWVFGSNHQQDRAFISAPLLEPKLSVRPSGRSSPYELPQPKPSPYELPPQYREATTAFSPVVPRDFTVAPEHERPIPPQPAQLASTPTIHAGFTTEAHPGTPVSIYAYDADAIPPAHYRDSDSTDSRRSMSSMSPIQPPPPLFARHERQDSTATSGSIEIGMRLSESMADYQSGEMLPARAMSSNNADLEKSLPAPPSEASPPKEQTPQQQTPPPQAAAPQTLAPPGNGGIGALGAGPKGGLRPMTNQPLRASPLANVMKAATPSPVAEKQNPFDAPGLRSSPNTSPVGSVSKGKTTPRHSPANSLGLPANPRARTPSPVPAAAPLPIPIIKEPEPEPEPEPKPEPKAPSAPWQAAPAPAHAPAPAPALAPAAPLSPAPNHIRARPESVAESVASSIPESPTEWPSWPAAKSPTEWPAWPAGDSVNLPPPEERRWA